MSNPLDDSFDAYTTIMDALKVVRRILDSQSQEMLDGTSLWGLNKREARDLLKRIEDEFQGLVVLSLFSFFENTIRSHLKSQLGPLAKYSSTPIRLGDELHRYISKEVDWWKMDEALDLFSSSVDSGIKGDSKHIKNYRDFVAHRGKPAAPVPPAIAYERLTKFLEQAGLV